MNHEETMEKMKAVCEKYHDGYMIVQCTNRLIVGRLSDEIDWKEVAEYGLDIRIFDKNREFRFFRGTIADEYVRREKDDGKEHLLPEDYYDEEQFLDIDEKRGYKASRNGVEVHAIGGGVYRIPLEGNKIRDAKIKIRNYVKYEEDTGRAYVTDWRCVEFLEGR